MTKQEYLEFEQSFKAFMTREGITNLSTIQAPDGESTEPYFSWHSCDCCGSPLGGNRYDADGFSWTI